MTNDLIYELAREHFGGKGHALIWQDDPRYAASCEMPQDARWSASSVSAEQTLAFARAILSRTPAAGAVAAPSGVPELEGLLAAVRDLPFVNASEIDGEESDGTPRHYRSRRYVSLTKLERLLRERLGAQA